MTTAVTLFTLFYFAVSLCFAFRQKEFVSVGLTIENLFDWYLGDIVVNFLYYQIKRTSLTLLIHSLIPLGYFVGVRVVAELHEEQFPSFTKPWWLALNLFSVIFPMLTIAVLWHWSRNKWSQHPITKTLKLFSDTVSWSVLIEDINREYRQLEKIVLETSSVDTVIATENWLMKVTPYGMNIAHQSDCVLILCSADTHEVSISGTGVDQYLNIEVKSTRQGVKNFYIRCNAFDFQNLQDRISRPISILQGITFHKSLIDQFLDVFKDSVSQNPPYILQGQQELDQCTGCMIVPSNVKLSKQCSGSCTNCYCRPLWCINCMGKWFASRQDPDHPETWLSSQCTCPMCRSAFCILDVCSVQKQ